MHVTPQVEKLTERHAENLENQARHILRNADVQADRKRALIGQLRRATQEYIDLGVAFVPSYLASDISAHLNMTPQTFFREVAAGTNRPFVYAFENGQYLYGNIPQVGWSSKSVNYVELALPRKRTTENLVAGLMLISANIENMSDLLSVTQPVAKEETARTWTFYFIDKPGRKVFDDWLEQCRTNPVFRLILKGTAK